MQKPILLCQNNKDLPALLEYYPCAIVKVYVYERVQLSVKGDPKLGRHCSKVKYVCKVFLILLLFLSNNFRVVVWS